MLAIGQAVDCILVGLDTDDCNDESGASSDLKDISGTTFTLRDGSYSS